MMLKAGCVLEDVCLSTMSRDRVCKEHAEKLFK